MSVTRWRQWSNAASSPMIDSTASGKPLVVVRARRAGARPRARRRSRGSRRGRRAAAAGRSSAGDRYTREQRLDRGEHALVERDRRRAASPSTVDRAAAGDERGRGSPADERPAAPALAVLDRLEQEAGLVAAAQPGERGDRRDQVGQQLAPHRHDGVARAARAVELVARSGSARHGGRRRLARRRPRKKHEYSPVWQAPLPSCSTTNSSVSPSQS